MKTPMQELIEKVNQWMIDDMEVINNPLNYEEYLVMHANQMVKVKLEFIDMCKSLLEKEKEVMCAFAFKCRNLMASDDFAITDWYDKTFNTKDK